MITGMNRLSNVEISFWAEPTWKILTKVGSKEEKTSRRKDTFYIGENSILGKENNKIGEKMWESAVCVLRVCLTVWWTQGRNRTQEKNQNYRLWFYY